MCFAYRDVGEGREQDAEASYLSTSFYEVSHVKLSSVFLKRCWFVALDVGRFL